MKSINRLPLMLMFVVSLLVLSACSNVPGAGGRLVMGDNFRLASGETLNDGLTVIGGNATLERDSIVNGDVAVMGGSVSINGTVQGDVSVMGGSVHLENNAVVRGSVSQLGGSISRAPGAVVEGIQDLDEPPFPSTVMRAPRFQVNFDPIAGPMLAFFRALALGALAVLVQLFAATPVQRVAHAAQTQPIVTGAIGLLTLLVAPALLVILAITIILLPVSLLGFLVLGVALVFGWLAVGQITGQLLARLFKQSWTEPISAGVGTLALSLVASMANLIFCIGWLPTFLVSVVGIGAVIITRFGTRFYVSSLPAAQPYAPPLAPVAAPAAGSDDIPLDIESEPDFFNPPAGEDPQAEDPTRPQA